MKGKSSVAIIGGDARQAAVADFFADKGFNVILWGIDIKDRESRHTVAGDCRAALEQADFCILPLTVSTDGLRLNCPIMKDKAPKLSDIADMIGDKTVVFGGKLPNAFREKLSEKGVCFFDYYEDECLCIKNALLTAEAAIEIAMREYNGTVDSSRTMVIGYGRIGKLLTNLLIKLNSDVTVAARKDSDLAYASCMGASVYKLNSEDKSYISEMNNGYDVIFNTVPARLFDAEAVRMINNKAVIIDLASAPGCMDIRQARDSGLKLIRALSLPGKYSPTRAGVIIAEAVYGIMKENGL